MDYALMRERLVKAREFIGQNRKEFAETLNIYYRTISTYENGAREPGSDYLAKVADVCGCTTDWLLGLSDDARCCSPYSSLLVQGPDSQFEMLRRNYDSLNEEGREKLTNYSDDLVQSGKYRKLSQPPVVREHKKTPIPVSEDGQEELEGFVRRYKASLTEGQQQKILEMMQAMIATQKPQLFASAPQTVAEKFPKTERPGQS